MDATLSLDLEGFINDIVPHVCISGQVKLWDPIAQV